MGSSKIIDEFKSELLAAELILNTDYSFELAEPNYLRCLDIIRNSPKMQSEFALALIALYEEKSISDEPIAYLMHVLRWPEVASWVERKLRDDPDAVATGSSLEKVLTAYGDNWENREFYEHL